MKLHPGTAIAHRFFAGTGRSYGLIVNLFTLGFDRWWKQRILREIPPNASHIVDQACGTGILTCQIARRFPTSRVTGVELRNEYLDIAKEKVRRLNLGNVDFLLGRAEEVRVETPVDCITSSYLAKYADLDSLIGNAKTMLSPGGRLVMHDFTYPAAPVFTRLWKRDCKPHYKSFQPRMWGLLERDLAHPALAPVRAWFDANVPEESRAAAWLGESAA